MANTKKDAGEATAADLKKAVTTTSDQTAAQTDQVSVSEETGRTNLGQGNVVAQTTSEPVFDESKAAMTQSQLNKAVVADYQKGLSPRAIVQKYSDRYPLKLSTVLEQVQPEGRVPGDKSGMVEQFSSTGE